MDHSSAHITYMAYSTVTTVQSLQCRDMLQNDKVKQRIFYPVESQELFTSAIYICLSSGSSRLPTHDLQMSTLCLYICSRDEFFTNSAVSEIALPD